VITAWILIPTKNLKERIWAIAHSYFFSFFASFFLLHFNQFYLKIYLKYLFDRYSICLAIELVLRHQKEAETGSAEVQPVRNIFGYLSI